MAVVVGAGAMAVVVMGEGGRVEVAVEVGAVVVAKEWAKMAVAATVEATVAAVQVVVGRGAAAMA
eukprot:1376269-Prymnesium_polylepis.1